MWLERDLNKSFSVLICVYVEVNVLNSRAKDPNLIPISMEGTLSIGDVFRFGNSSRKFAPTSRREWERNFFHSKIKRSLTFVLCIVFGVVRSSLYECKASFTLADAAITGQHYRKDHSSSKPRRYSPISA